MAMAAPGTFPPEQCAILPFAQFCGDVSAKNSVAGLCSLADTYLAYTYLCKTGLWREVTLAAHPTEGYVLCCVPRVPASDDADIDTTRGVEEAGGGEASSSDSGSDGEQGGGEEPGAAAGGSGGAAAAAAPAEKELQRHGRALTVTVPASLARGALSFARLSRLFPLVEAYGAKRLDVATVDNDGTVIVSHLYDYPLAPEPLVVSTEEANKDDDLLE